MQKYLRPIHNLFITNKLSLLLKPLSTCDNLTLIKILYNNDVLTWDYKNNRISSNNVIINQKFSRERSKYFC